MVCSLRKAPSSVKSAGVHSVLSPSGLVSDLRGGRRKRAGIRRSCCFVSTSAGQLRPCEKYVDNQLGIPLALVDLDNGLVAQ